MDAGEESCEESYDSATDQSDTDSHGEDGELELIDLTTMNAPRQSSSPSPGSAIPNAFIIQPVYSNGQGNPQQGPGDRVILLNSGVPLGNAVSNAFFSADGGFGQASAVNTASSFKSFSADGGFGQASAVNTASSFKSFSADGGFGQASAVNTASSLKSFSADSGFGQASTVNTASSLKSFSADGRFDEGLVTSDAVRQTKQQFHVENLSPLVSLSTCASGVSGGFNSDQMPHNVNLADQYAGRPFFNYPTAPYPSPRSQYHHGDQRHHGFQGHQSFKLPGAPGVAMGGASHVGYSDPGQEWPTTYGPSLPLSKTLRIDTTVEPKLLKLYFENEDNLGGSIVGQPVDHRSSGGYVLITFREAEVAYRLLNREHTIRAENLRISLHRESPNETTRTVWVVGPPQLINDTEYLKLYFASKTASGGGPVDQIEYNQENQVTRIVFKDACVASAVLGREHTLDDHELQVSASVPSKPEKANKKATDTNAPISPPSKMPQVRKVMSSQSPQKTPAPRTTDTPATHRQTKPPAKPLTTTTCPKASDPKASSDQQSTVSVRGLDLYTTRHDALFLYFENKRRSGVEHVSCMVRDFKNQVVYISFPCTDQDAMKVLRRNHTLDDQGLDLRLAKMPDLDRKHLALWDLSEDIDTKSLQEFIKKETGEPVVSIHDWEGVFVVRFQRDIDLAATQTTLRQTEFHDQPILADPLLVTNKVLMRGLPQDTHMSKRSAEGALKTIAGVTNADLDPSTWTALITFQDAEAAEAAVGKKLRFKKCLLESFLFSESVGMEFDSSRPAPSRPDPTEMLDPQVQQFNLNMQAAQDPEAPQSQQVARTLQHEERTSPTSDNMLSGQFESTQWEDGSQTNFSSLQSVASIATSSSGMSRGIEETRLLGTSATKVSAEKKTKATVAASPAKQQYCQENKIGQEIIDRGLSVSFNPEEESIEIEGKDQDVADMREVVEMTLSFLHTASHTWDARYPADFLMSEAVRSAVKEACLKYCLQGRGALAFTPDVFEVAVWDDRRSATRLKDTGAAVLTIKTVILQQDYNDDPEQKAKRELLVSSLQSQSQNKVVVRENPPAQLLVMGVCDAVDRTAKQLEDFLSRESQAERQAERQFPLPQEGTETLFWEFFDQAQTRLVRGADIDVTDGQIVAKGNADVVQNAAKLIRDFERSLVTIRKAISEPSIQRLMLTQEWKQNFSFLESQHRCKITPENDLSQQLLYAARSASPVSDSDFNSAFNIPASKPDSQFGSSNPGFRFGSSNPGSQFGSSNPGFQFGSSNPGFQFGSRNPGFQFGSSNPGYQFGSSNPGSQFGSSNPGFQFGSSNPGFQFGSSNPGSQFGSSNPGSSNQAAGPADSGIFKPRIHLYSRSDLTRERHGLLVNSTPGSLALDSGKVSRSLLRAGGSSIQQECHRKYPDGINPGDVAVTNAGRLHCEKMAHCCLPDTQARDKMGRAVEKVVTKCLEKADKYGLDSVAFPAIGTGTLRYPPDIVAKAMYEATLAYGRRNPGTTIDDVSFVLLTEDVHNHSPFENEHQKYKKRLMDAAARQNVPVPTLPQTTLNNFTPQGVRSFDYFSKTRETATFRIVALSHASGNAAAAELEKMYRDSVKSPSYDTQHLGQWDDLQLKTLLSACKQVHVDVMLNFDLNRIELRGFLSDLDRIRTHEIIKEAEQGVHEMHNALLMLKQVQWSRIDVGRTGEFLTPYDPVKNYQIEMAYRNEDPTKMLGASYVDFAKWQELPETPGDRNHPPVSIHRHSIIEERAYDTPRNWTDMGDDTLDVIPLSQHTAEYERVQRIFRDSVNHPSVRVVSIQRVQNLTLYRQYMALKTQMEKRVKDCEMFALWHGTKEKCVDGIIRFGFNRSYSGDSKRCAHGQGVYFATEAEYSCQNQYAKKDSHGQRRLFLCRVLVGRYVKGDNRMRVADHTFHDSAVDDDQHPSIFVIFKDVQAYPEYLIVCRDN